MGRRVFVVSPSRFIAFRLGMRLRDGEGVMIERYITGRLRYLEVNGWTPFSGENDQIVRMLRDVGRKTGAVFVRWTPSESQKSKVKSQKFIGIQVVTPRVLIHQVPPRTTLVIGLSKSEEELLSAMHEKARYNIRLAERRGIRVRRAGVDESFRAFWSLMRETAKRGRVGIHAREYYRKMLETVQGGDVQARLFLAVHREIPLATAILITCGDTATYLHGGSSSEQRNLMAPHLLQWRMMQYAKHHRMKWYDMWGIAPQDERGKTREERGYVHPWTGITRFKLGFGGEVKESVGTFDIICRPFVYRVLSLGRLAKHVLRPLSSPP